MALTIEDGVSRANLPLKLAEGSVLVGDSDSTASALDAKTSGQILVGNGTTITSVALSGDVTMDSAGAMTVGIAEGNILVGNSDGEAAALDASTSGQILVGNGTTLTSVAVSGDVTMDATGAFTIASGAVEDAMLAANVASYVAGSGGDTMSREENVAGLSSAITLANEIRGDFINHAANATRHTTGQQDTTGIAAEATDLATLLTLSASLMALYVAHNADAILTESWAYHSEQATTKALASEVAPTNLQEAITKLNDLKAKYNDHEDETTGHASEASVTADQVAAADADYGATNRVPVSGVVSGDIVSWSILNSGTGTVTGVSATAGTDYIDFEFSDDPQNDAIISYLVMHPAE